MTLPKISVLIATRNRCFYLKRSLDQLLLDDYPNLEIIVVDGASNDGTVELLKGYGDRIARWISEPDSGEYFAFNKAILMASGEIIKLMTDDDVLRLGAFRLVADYFMVHPEVEIVFGQTTVWKEKDGKRFLIQELNETNVNHLSLKGFLRAQHKITSLGSFLRRSVFTKIGPLSTEYKIGDAEFWIRAASKGIKMGLMPEVVVDYIYTGENGVTKYKWVIPGQNVKIGLKYGTLLDVFLIIWREYVVKFTYGPIIEAGIAWFHQNNLHPVRLVRRLLTGKG